MPEQVLQHAEENPIGDEGNARAVAFEEGIALGVEQVAVTSRQM